MKDLPFWSLKIRKSFCLAAFICFLLTYSALFVFRPVSIEGYSMYPWIQTGDIVLVNMFDHTPERGQVITCTQDGIGVIKRVVGLAGDKIMLIGDMAYVIEPEALDMNDHVVFGKESGHVKIIIVPEGHVYVLGDNRKTSLDSRYLGPVPVEDIEGVVVARIWR